MIYLQPLWPCDLPKYIKTSVHKYFKTLQKRALWKSCKEQYFLSLLWSIDWGRGKADKHYSSLSVRNCYSASGAPLTRVCRVFFNNLRVRLPTQLKLWANLRRATFQVLNKSAEINWHPDCHEVELHSLFGFRCPSFTQMLFQFSVTSPVPWHSEASR